MGITVCLWYIMLCYVVLIMNNFLCRRTNCCGVLAHTRVFTSLHTWPVIGDLFVGGVTHFEQHWLSVLINTHLKQHKHALQALGVGMFTDCVHICRLNSVGSGAPPFL